MPKLKFIFILLGTAVVCSHLHASVRPHAIGDLSEVPCFIRTRFETLADEEVARLSADEMDNDAQTYLVHKYSDLLNLLIDKYSLRADDYYAIESAASEGLLVATREFEFERGFKFITYAYTLIERHIQQRHARKKAIDRLTIQPYERANGLQSDFMSQVADRGTMEPDDATVERILERRAEAENKLKQLMKKLSTTDRRIVKARFFGKSQKTHLELSSKWKTSKQNIANWEARAIDNLRAVVASDSGLLAEYAGYDREFASTFKKVQKVKSGAARNFFELDEKWREVYFPKSSTAIRRPLLARVFEKLDEIELEAVVRSLGIDGSPRETIAKIAQSSQMKDATVRAAFNRAIQKIRDWLAEDLEFYAPLIVLDDLQ